VNANTRYGVSEKKKGLVDQIGGAACAKRLREKKMSKGKFAIREIT